jgi:hypothetical protein
MKLCIVQFIHMHCDVLIFCHIHSCAGYVNHFYLPEAGSASLISTVIKQNVIF